MGGAQILTGAMGLAKTIVTVRAQVDARSAERARIDDVLGEELRGLVQKVHEQCVQVEKAIASTTAPEAGRVTATGRQDGLYLGR